MTRARLEGLPLPTLLELAQQESLTFTALASREDVIEALWDVYEEDRRERESLNNLITKLEETKFGGLRDEYPLSLRPVDPLPERYDDTGVTLLLRDPDWAFVFWEVKGSDYASVNQEYGFKYLAIRLLEMAELQDPPPANCPYFNLPLQSTHGTRYINLPSPRSWYQAELRAIFSEKESRLLARSRPVWAPAAEPAYLEGGSMSPEQRALLELSGLWTCEPMRGRAQVAPNRDVPQRVGDWSDS